MHNPDSSHGFCGAALSTNVIHFWKSIDENLPENTLGTLKINSEDLSEESLEIYVNILRSCKKWCKKSKRFCKKWQKIQQFPTRS